MPTGCARLVAVAGHADPEAQSPANAARLKVIYVMGAGRSGTTILGVALGNCSDFVFAGELNQWLAKAGVPTYGTAQREHFWADVRRDLDGAAGLFGGKTRCLERSSALVDIREWPARRRLRAPYLTLSRELYGAIARAAAVDNIVDSSHYPLRARELRRLTDIDIYLLYVRRDPEAVLASLGRKDVPERSFDLPTTNAYLWLTHLVSVFVFLTHPRERRLFLRHEDFVKDPDGVLQQILQWLGSSAALPDLSSLHTGIALHGNRLIASSVVALEPGDGAPRRRSHITKLLQLPWSAIHSMLRPVVRARPAGRTDSHEGILAQPVNRA